MYRRRDQPFRCPGLPPHHGHDQLAADSAWWEDSFLRPAILLALFAASMLARPVLVISVDGLDSRYLANPELKIPNIRRLMKEGQAAQGVLGVVPTVTWPSHTTMISGVTPDIHGILGNRRPREEGGDYYWSAKLLKAPTLLDAMQKAGRTTATITWPVTVDAPVTYNLPEFFKRRRGGAMDNVSIASKSNPPDLAARISAMFPSFGQEWMDDRVRSLAAIYLLKTYKPDLMLIHMVDLDSEAHDNGPFTPQAHAILEYTDELIGNILKAMPADYAFALVSDHGFERVDHEINLNLLVKGVRPMGGIAIAETDEGAAWMRSSKYVMREIPHDEVARLAPRLANAKAVFESAEHVWFGSATSGEVESKPHEIGTHGHWPTRYRAVYIAWGKGIKSEKLPEIRMTDIAGRLAALAEIPFKP